MKKDFEFIADKKSNERFTRWLCDECQNICELADSSHKEPMGCPHVKGNSKWIELDLPIYKCLEDVAVGLMGDKKTEFKYNKKWVNIKIRKDVLGRNFYDLYVSGKYIDSFIHYEDAEEKKKEFVK